MIYFFSSLVKNLSLSIVIVSILEMIIPNNKTKKYIKVVMGLYILFTIISPFVKDKISFENISVNSYLEDKNVDLISIDQTSMDTRLDEIYTKRLEEDIKSKLLEKGYELEYCKVKAHISSEDSGIESIKVRINYKNKKENKKEQNSIEDRIVTVIEKIKIGNTNRNESINYEEVTNINKEDLKEIKDFFINEYGVDEKCLKIN